MRRMGVREGWPPAISSLTEVRQELRERMVADLRRENDQLSLKLAQVGRAARTLAVELADARRELRTRQRQIAQLEAENARLGGVAHRVKSSADPSVADVADNAPAEDAPSPTTAVSVSAFN